MMKVLLNGNDRGQITEQIDPHMRIVDLKNFFRVNYPGFDKITLTFNNGETLSPEVWITTQYDQIDLMHYAKFIDGGTILLEQTKPLEPEDDDDEDHIYEDDYNEDDDEDNDDDIYVLINVNNPDDDGVWAPTRNEVLKGLIKYHFQDFLNNNRRMRNTLKPETLAILERAFRREPFNFEDIDEDDKESIEHMLYTNGFKIIKCLKTPQ